MEERKDDSPALAAFLQALGLTICGLESVQPENRTRRNFIFTFNTNQEAMVDVVEEQTGRDVRETLMIFNQELDKVMDLIDQCGLHPDQTNWIEQEPY